MIKSCGGCKHWIKLKNDDKSSGICGLQDGRSNSDDVCDKWKAMPFPKKKYRKLN